MSIREHDVPPRGRWNTLDQNLKLKHRAPGESLASPCAFPACLAVHSTVTETILQEKKGMHESSTLGTGLFQDLKGLHKHHSWDMENKVSG